MYVLSRAKSNGNHGKTVIAMVQEFIFGRGDVTISWLHDPGSCPTLLFWAK